MAVTSHFRRRLVPVQPAVSLVDDVGRPFRSWGHVALVMWPATTDRQADDHQDGNAACVYLTTTTHTTKTRVDRVIPSRATLVMTWTHRRHTNIPIACDRMCYVLNRSTDWPVKSAISSKSLSR